jgi:hypothetical protein
MHLLIKSLMTSLSASSDDNLNFSFGVATIGAGGNIFCKDNGKDDRDDVDGATLLEMNAFGIRALSLS